MQLTIGRGNNRQTFDLPSGKEAKSMARNDAVNFTKIKGAIMSRVRDNAARVRANAA
jgi:hypothetical protein